MALSLERRRRTQGCLTDCIAYLLNLHPEHVPHFVHPNKGWMVRVRRFLRRHGYAARWVLADRPPGRGTHIVCGDSLAWKNHCHVVVYRAGKLVYDPQYPSKWKDSRITHRLIVTRLPHVP